MGDSETGQISADAAKIYDELYLPALFEEWCPMVVEAAQIKEGHRVIDIACGTGALAIAILDRIGAQGSIVGIDINEGMLDVAKLKSSRVEGLNAPAEALPFGDDNFDCAVSQFGLMYFEDRESALREMIRVVQPGGSLAIVVWDKLENNPGFAAEERLWQHVFGLEAADESPNNLGDKKTLRSLFSNSGMPKAEITTRGATARYSSIESWILAGARGWTEDDAISDEQLDLLLKAAHKELADFRTADGTVAFPTSAHIITARK